MKAEPVSDRNTLVEPNEFLKKVINAKAGDDAEVFEFSRRHYGDVRTFVYTINARIAGTRMYTEYWLGVDCLESNMDEIAGHFKTQKREFLQTIEGGAPKALLSLVSDALGKKYDGPKFFKDLDFNGGWRGVEEILGTYIPERGFKNHLEAYSHCIEHFREHMLEKYQKKTCVKQRQGKINTEKEIKGET